jgi:hypothetical protein
MLPVAIFFPSEKGEHRESIPLRGALPKRKSPLTALFQRAEQRKIADDREK